MVVVVVVAACRWSEPCTVCECVCVCVVPPLSLALSTSSDSDNSCTPASFVTVIVYVVGPAVLAVGVPEIVPLMGFSIRPLGRAGATAYLHVESCVLYEWRG